VKSLYGIGYSFANILKLNENVKYSFAKMSPVFVKMTKPIICFLLDWK